MPHWTWPGREGETLTVQCYSSCRRVELFVNGVSQGIQTKNPKSLLRRYRLVWPEVIYEPGELRAVAIDENGQVCNEKIIRTAGNVAQIKLSADRTCIKPDGRDMAFITVELTDGAGYLCPDADNLLDFSVSGPAEIVACGNGDPSSLEDFTAQKRQAFHGKCVVYLRSKPDADKSGTEEIILSAKTNIGDESFSSSIKLQSRDSG